MQEVHLTCALDRMLATVEALSEQFVLRKETVSVLDYGACQKSTHASVVLQWVGEVDEEFLEQLNADTSVLDYCVYSVPADEDTWPFGMELYREEGRAS